MTIGTIELLAVLGEIASRTPRRSVYAKATDGRLVRFVEWKRAARQFFCAGV